tara:strand:- start:11265 stop:12293 length:1029 start_codon:yes stop_codon:yes gene_type:complete
MSLTTEKAASKKVSIEWSSIDPSSLITLFEIDVSDVGFDNNASLLGSNKIFRFHNSIKLIAQDIFFDGEKYIASPIVAENFGRSAKGKQQSPKLTVSVNDTGIPALTDLKTQIKELGDLVGAKLTRIRTFVKYIDKKNFDGQSPPDGFSPDSEAKYPSDIFFIKRKTLESKNTIQYELQSPMDVEGTKLPRRQVTALTCRFSYRGEGCAYEFDGESEFLMRKNSTEHGDAVLPNSAPPVATANDELIYGNIITDGSQPNNQGEFDLTKEYSKGSFIYILKKNIKYYFVAILNVPKGFSPPDNRYWIEDQCSKCISGCKLRWTSIGSGHLPFGGFPGVEKLGS